ncbi:hypothetical protein [Aliiroseovarius sp. YM-037]|uniref:hypothetical protein n=1 Tax=Aliiroseovarius sp. YM-037 TaxID=3341728 RepID=UPI003A80D46D
MTQGTLLWLAALLIAIGALPFLSVGIASVILWANGCMGPDGLVPCALYDDDSSGVLANMLLAGWYAIISIPIGLIGIVLLIFAVAKRPAD